MRSRLLTELEAQSSNTKDRVAWSRVMCRISIHHSRQGDPERAHEYILAVRKHYGVELHHVVASWVMLAEGILHFTKAEMDKAYDRLRRAYGLAVALRTESARPLCAAWMALAEFNAGKYPLMVDHLTEVLRDAADTDHQARGRACLVLADALQLAGSFEMARPWYELTRIHAAAEGDQATLSAYLYNVAAFRTLNLRLSEAYAEVSPTELKRASMEAHSSFSYDMAVGSLAFGTFWKVLHGQLQNIQGEFSEAKILLDAISIPDLVPRDIPLVHCELAWSNLNLGNEEAARRNFHRAAEKIELITEHDDRAYILKRLAMIGERLGLQEAASQYALDGLRALEQHRTFQAGLMTMLRSLVEQHPPPKMKKGPAAR